MNQPLKISENDEYSHYRITTNQYGQQVAVPVIDVRDGPAHRVLAYQMIKAANRSKYINYNEYHVSQKTKRNHGTSM
jgi:hypothetical protein